MKAQNCVIGIDDKGERERERERTVVTRIKTDNYRSVFWRSSEERAVINHYSGGVINQIRQNW